MYELASALESEGKPQAAYRLFGDYLCEGTFSTPSAGNEHPCVKAAALQKRIDTAYKQSMEKLVAYRAAHGHYPTALDEVSSELSESVRQVVRGFEYVRKSDSEIAIVTGMYGPTAFELNQTPNPSIERTCPGKPGQASHLKR